MIGVREARDADWSAVGALADLAVRHLSGAPRQGEWLKNRIVFPGRQWRFVAECASDVVGFGALEAQGGGGAAVAARQFLVLSWRAEGAGAVADALLTSRLNAMVLPLRGAAWPEGAVRVDERFF